MSEETRIPSPAQTASLSGGRCLVFSTKIVKIEAQEFEVEVKVLDMQDPYPGSANALKAPEDGKDRSVLEVYILKGEIDAVNGTSYRCYQSDGEIWGFSEDATDIGKAVHLGIMKIMQHEEDR